MAITLTVFPSRTTPVWAPARSNGLPYRRDDPLSHPGGLPADPAKPIGRQPFLQDLLRARLNRLVCPQCRAFNFWNPRSQ